MKVKKVKNRPADDQMQTMIDHHGSSKSIGMFKYVIRFMRGLTAAQNGHHHLHHHNGQLIPSPPPSSAASSVVTTNGTLDSYSTSSLNRSQRSSKVKTPQPTFNSMIINYYNNGSAALTGIKNHGNTCFMNAIIQCLCQTDLLAEYFIMNHYRCDLDKHQEISRRKSISLKGDVTTQLAALIKSLWSNQYSPEISSKFKITVSKFNKQYEGSEQHDAQEFLLWLLDRLHEDLNVSAKKKYKKFKQSLTNNHNRPDELIAAESLVNHIRCTNSFIRDLFQAQLRSSLVCRSCNNHSNTFDPYLCLSLPVPNRLTNTIIVNVTFTNDIFKLFKLAVSIEAQSNLRELRDKVSRLIKVPEKQLVLLMKDGNSGIKELSKDTLLIQDLLCDMDEIEAVETAKKTEFYDEVDGNISIVGPTIEPTNEKLILVWTNRVGIGSNNKVFGPFFSCQIDRDVSFKALQLEMMKSMKPILRKTCDFNVIKDSTLFRLRVINGQQGNIYLTEEVDLPLYMPYVDESLQQSEAKDYRGPNHLKLIVEWDLDLKQTLVIDDDELPKPIEDTNIEYIKSRTALANRATLRDCFEMYFHEEKLGADNAWMCPACRKRQQCIKKLSLWSTPDVFIIHLKRSTTQRLKLATLVSFPLSGLDMSVYMSERPVANGAATKIDLPSANVNLSPWRRRNVNNGNVYDLYAVCNHHANMQAGHYTAYCKNLVDGKWYSFDDQKVAAIEESSVVTDDAYLLFYQRSSAQSSSVSSCSMSTSDSNNSTSAIGSSVRSNSQQSDVSGARAKELCNGDVKSPIGECNKENSIMNHSQPASLRGQKAYSTLPSKIRTSSSSLPPAASSSQTLKTRHTDKSDANGSKLISNSLSSSMVRQSPLVRKYSSHSLLLPKKESKPISGDTSSILTPAVGTTLMPGDQIKIASPLKETQRFWTVTSV